MMINQFLLDNYAVFKAFGLGMSLGILVGIGIVYCILKFKGEEND